ncbi:hypothetical protein AVEN_185020-1 [Araneus ventricosus]|uniref:Uncharacterized protein n=1 Tax=Araneus ventricosus TaxID=182803 RepID=A0A4Y2BPR0_ARAVE|nr:hypothetical protein AVEN_185020-1 [Araneus ventricosus]
MLRITVTFLDIKLQLPLNIRITGSEACVIPLDLFLYTGVKEIRRRRAEPASDNRLSARGRHWGNTASAGTFPNAGTDDSRWDVRAAAANVPL